MRGLFRHLVEKQAVTPYIMGHITDGSSTFTFTVNNNESVTVDVRADGWWKWTKPFNQNITSLYQCFYNNSYIDTINIFGFDEVDSISGMCQNCSNLEIVKIIPINNLNSISNCNNSFNGCSELKNLIIGNGFRPNGVMYGFLFGVKNINSNQIKKEWFLNTTSVNRINMNGRLTSLDLSLADNSTNFEYILQNNGVVETLYLPNIGANVPFICGAGTSSLEIVTIKSTKSNLNFGGSSSLSKNSVLNIINASIASVTHTLHSTVYNKCASGGEWYTDIQAAIDAKALEGYTVTLISA